MLNTWAFIDYNNDKSPNDNINELNEDIIRNGEKFVEKFDVNEFISFVGSLGIEIQENSSLDDIIYLDNENYELLKDDDSENHDLEILKQNMEMLKQENDELKKQNQELKSKIKDLSDKLKSIQQQFSEAKQNYTIKK